VTVWVVVVAAGGGHRFGGRKQFAEIDGRPLVRWSVEAARSVADGIVLVVPADIAGTAGTDATDVTAGTAGTDATDATDTYGADVVVAGGSTRTGSVRAGLEAVPGEAEVIVVHDGARPLASADLFRSVVEAVTAGAAAAVPGLALADTVKHVEDDVVVSTVDRRGLVTVQTPQAFRAEVLRGALESGDDATDDAGLVEALGATVRVVNGEPRNLKVTTPDDLDMVRALIRALP
jgi:2-C-methyl-D-erythritol 4-phosphate cytidylyltransferase